MKLRFPYLLAALASCTSLNTFALPQAMCDQYKLTNPGAYNSMVRSGGCQGDVVDSSRDATKARQAAHKAKSVNANENTWKQYNSQYEYCSEGLGGDWYGRDNCRLDHAPYKAMFERHKADSSNREFDYLAAQWGDKDLIEICESFDARPHTQDQCYFAEGGLVNSQRNHQVSYYLRERKRREDEQRIAHANDMKALFARLPASAANAKLTELTGLIAVTGDGVTSWQAARNACKTQNMDLPSGHELEESQAELIGFLKQGHTYFSAFTHDYIGAVTRQAMNKKYHLSYKPKSDDASVLCKAYPSTKLAELDQQMANEERLIETYTATTGLEFWQKLAEIRDNQTLILLTTYSDRAMSTRLGDSFAEFELVNGGWTHTSRYIAYYDTRDATSNIFSWAFKADASQRNAFSKRMAGQSSLEHYGITQDGLKSFIDDLKKQELFTALENINATENDYTLTITGDFTDLQGQTHRVYIEVEATGVHISVDYHWS